MTEYTCSVCDEHFGVCAKKFDEKEKELTNDENKCILHCDKVGWEEIHNLHRVNFFWKKMKDYYNMIMRVYKENKNKENKKLYEFYQVKFPIFMDTFSDFYEFNEDFKKNKVEQWDIKFLKCTFYKNIDFIHLFYAKNITFRDCEFMNNIELKNQSFEHNFLFEECTVYKNITFQMIQFKNFTSFIGTTFNKEVNFKHTKFYDLALFNNTKINKLRLENTFFMDESNFLNMKNEKKQPLKSKNIHDRETARIIKHSFEKINNIIEANQYYAIEMEKRKDELKIWKNPFDWLVFKFHRLSSNHSQNWILPIFWIFFISYLVTSVKTTYGIFETILYNIFIYGVLDKMANIINPFSIMIRGESLTFNMLFFKVIIAYLMYQFVVSIRQNTRRK